MEGPEWRGQNGEAVCRGLWTRHRSSMEASCLWQTCNCEHASFTHSHNLPTLSPIVSLPPQLRSQEHDPSQYAPALPPPPHLGWEPRKPVWSISSPKIYGYHHWSICRWDCNWIIEGPFIYPSTIRLRRSGSLAD